MSAALRLPIPHPLADDLAAAHADAQDALRRAAQTTRQHHHGVLALHALMTKLGGMLGTQAVADGVVRKSDDTTYFDEARFARAIEMDADDSDASVVVDIADLYGRGWGDLPNDFRCVNDDQDFAARLLFVYPSNKRVLAVYEVTRID